MLCRKTMARVALVAALLTLALPALPAHGAPLRGDAAGAAVAAWHWIGDAWSALAQELSAIFAADGIEEPPAGGEIGPIPDPNGITGGLPDPGTEIGPTADPNG